MKLFINVLFGFVFVGSVVNGTSTTLVETSLLPTSTLFPTSTAGTLTTAATTGTTTGTTTATTTRHGTSTTTAAAISSTSFTTTATTTALPSTSILTTRLASSTIGTSSTMYRYMTSSTTEAGSRDDVSSTAYPLTTRDSDDDETTAISILTTQIRESTKAQTYGPTESGSSDNDESTSTTENLATYIITGNNGDDDIYDDSGETPDNEYSNQYYLEVSISMTVTKIWDEDAVDEIWGVLEDGLEEILEGSDVDTDDAVYYMISWDATQHYERRRRRQLGSDRRLLQTTTILPTTTIATTIREATTTIATTNAASTRSAETTETTAGATNGPTVRIATTARTTAIDESSDDFTTTGTTTQLPTFIITDNINHDPDSISFDFTVRVYAGDDESVVSELYDYLVALGTAFGSDYQTYITALALAIDSDGFGDITISSASIALYDNDGNVIEEEEENLESTSTNTPSGTDDVPEGSSDAFKKYPLWLSILCVIVVTVFHAMYESN